MSGQANLSEAESIAVAWALGELGCGASATPPLAGPRVLVVRSGFLRRQPARRGPFSLNSVARDQETVVVSLRNPKHQTYQLRLRVDDGTLTAIAFGQLPPEGFVLREADDRDIEKIAEIERCSPIEMEDGRQFAIYRPRLRDFLRLQERNFKALIERDGKPVAARIYAGRSLTFRDGKTMAVFTSQIARVLPSMRGYNLMHCFQLWAGIAVSPHRDLLVAYVDPGNRIVDAAFTSEDQEWKRHALELTFACASLAGPGDGRAATAGDAVRLAELSNSTHGQAALYGTLNGQLVRQRLERAPDVYSWGDLLLSDHAMLGVWPSLDETTDAAPGQAPRRRTLSVVLDYGFEGEAGLDELLELLRSQAERVRLAGATHLTLYTHPGSSVARLLMPLAEDSAELAIQVGSEPAECDGVYTDPLYL